MNTPKFSPVVGLATDSQNNSYIRTSIESYEELFTFQQSIAKAINRIGYDIETEELEGTKRDNMGFVLMQLSQFLIDTIHETNGMILDRVNEYNNEIAA